MADQARISDTQPATPKSTAGSPPVVKTVVPARPSADPRNPTNVEHSKTGMGAAVGWIVLLVLLGLAVLSAFFFIPGMKANMIENDRVPAGQPAPNQPQNR